jgi:hypothetical protein
LISTVGRPRRTIGGSFYQGLDLVERAHNTKIPESQAFSAKQPYSTLGVC